MSFLVLFHIVCDPRPKVQLTSLSTRPLTILHSLFKDRIKSVKMKVFWQQMVLSLEEVFIYESKVLFFPLKIIYIYRQAKV